MKVTAARTIVQLAVVLAALTAVAVFAGTASASAPGSYFRGTLICELNSDNSYQELMMEQAPFVRAADTTPYLDRQRIWLHVTNYVKPYAALDFIPEDGMGDLWLYADATDNAYTNQWHVTSGALANGAAAGYPNIVSQDLIFSGNHTYRNDFWFPNASGAYPSISASTWLSTSVTTGSINGIPTC